MSYNIKLQLPFAQPFKSVDWFNSLDLAGDNDYGHDLPTSYISDEAIEFFASRDLIVSGCEYFMFSPNYVQQIHVDGSKICDKVKFNWSFGSEHVFNFYEINQNWRQRMDGLDGQSSHYFTSEEVNLVDSRPIYAPSMCKVGRPHNIINGGNTLKLFNITVWKKGTVRTHEHYGGLDMSEALIIFNDYVL